MPVRHIDEIGELYSTNVSPVTDKELKLEEQEVANRRKLLTEAEEVKAKRAQDSAFDGESKKENGFDSATTPDGVQKAELDTQNSSTGESAFSVEKFSNPVKKEQKEINNSTMKENQNQSRSTFDRLFEDVMGGEEVDLGMETEPGMDDMMGGEEEDLGGGDLASRLREVAELLVGIADDMNGEGGEEEIEDMEDVAEMEGDEFGESYTNFDHDHNFTGGQAVVDGTHEHAGLQGKSNKVSGSGHQVSGHGHGDGGSGGQEDGGKPKPVAGGQAVVDGSHEHVGLQGKNNKVGGKVSGGNKDLFRA